MFITEEYIQKYLSWKSPNCRIKKSVREDILADQAVNESEILKSYHQAPMQGHQANDQSIQG